MQEHLWHHLVAFRSLGPEVGLSDQPARAG